MLHLNKYQNVEFYSLRGQTINGVTYTRGQKLTNPQGLKKLESLMRTHRIVGVTADRNLQPKMWYRELRSPEYCHSKYGFVPSLAAGIKDDWDPNDHSVDEIVEYAADYPSEATRIKNEFDPGETTIPEVLAFVAVYPAHLTRIIADETAGLARSTLLTGLNAAKTTVTSITPATGLAAGGTATAIVGTHLGRVTSVTFGGSTGTSFSVLSETSIHVTTPAHAAGAVSVVFVGADGGNVTKTTFYTYT